LTSPCKILDKHTIVDTVCLKWTYATILLMLALSINQSIMKWTSHILCVNMNQQKSMKI